MSLLTTGLSLVGGSQVKLIILAVAATAILSAVGGTALYVRHLRSSVETLEKQKSDLIVDNKIFKDNNDVLKDNMKKLATANLTNYNTAQSLIADKAQSTRAIANLAAARVADRQSFDRLTGKIEAMLKDPKNDGPVAPVLREVIREIQKERDVK